MGGGPQECVTQLPQVQHQEWSPLSSAPGGLPTSIGATDDICQPNVTYQGCALFLKPLEAAEHGYDSAYTVSPTSPLTSIGIAESALSPETYSESAYSPNDQTGRSVSPQPRDGFLTASTALDLQPTQQIVVIQLKTRPDLNGQMGIVVNWDETHSRWRVRLGDSTTKLFRSRNLQRIESPFCTQSPAEQAVGRRMKPGETAPGVFSMTLAGEYGGHGYQPSHSSLHGVLQRWRIDEDELMQLRFLDGVEGVLLDEVVSGRMGSSWALSWYPLGTTFLGRCGIPGGKRLQSQ